MKIKINKKQVINISVLILGVLGIFLTQYFYPFNNWSTFSTWGFMFGGIFGITSVYFCNQKNLIHASWTGLTSTILLLISTIYIPDWTSSGNWGFFLLQSTTLGIGIFQITNWLKMIKKDSLMNGKFKTRRINKKYVAIGWISTLIITMFLLNFFTIDTESYNNPYTFATLDSLAMGGSKAGAILMGLGSTWGFGFFLIADILWVAKWSVSESPETITMIVSNTIYAIYAILGYFEWKQDNSQMKKLSKEEIRNFQMDELMEARHK